MYTTVATMSDAEQCAAGTVGWDCRGTPVARDGHGWFLVGGERITDLAARLPLVVPLPLPFDAERIDDESPCETCSTEEHDRARPAPAEPAVLLDRVAAIIRAEFPDTHPHSHANRLRSELSAARVLTFLRYGIRPSVSRA